ncbi:MAG TPA: cytochrome P450, partial [Acidimicrobiia bacterium]|nr:cytochrome P450 [Acidimicrobiia bacterium]
ITTGVYLLLHQDLWKWIVAEPEIAPNAVTELLRYAPPIGVARLAAQDMVAQDVELRAGQLALLSIENACHDPQRYDEPDAIDFGRDPGKQMMFGAGPHFCLGANLAKVTYTVALEMLAMRFPGLSLAGGPDDVTWDYETFHGIVHLPVRLH